MENQEVKTGKTIDYTQSLRVMRDERGRIKPGSISVNPAGQRGHGGFSVAEYTRRYLNYRPEGKKNGKTRLRMLMDNAYAIASNAKHKQCMAAIQFLVTRAFGEVPKEISIKLAAIQALQSLPNEHRNFLAEMFAGGDDTLLLSAGEVEQDESEFVEAGKRE